MRTSCLMSRYPRFRFLIGTMLVGSAIASPPAFASRQNRHYSTASQLVAAAVEAMGGADRLRALHTIRLSGETYEQHLYEAEPPDQPYYVTHQHFAESRDLARRRFRRLGWTMDSLHALVQIGSDGIIEIRQGGAVRTTRLHADWIDLSPERLMLTAAAAGDLHTIGDTTISGVHELGIAFTWMGLPVRVWLNAFTNLPMIVDYPQSYPESISSGVWGDVNLRVSYGAWIILPGGLHYPTQINQDWNGVPFRTTVLSDVVPNPTLIDSDYVHSAGALASAQQPGSLNANDIPLGEADRPAAEIEPGVVQIPGAWYTTIVRQSDGIVVIDAPISSGYSSKVLAEATRRYPETPVKAVITTSNYWWHIAGLREYVARGIPVYALDANQGEIHRLVAAPHRIDPDHLENSKRAARLHVVSRRTVIGSGRNRLELFPIRTSTTSLMLMVYMPSYQLLYSSDMAQPLGPNGSFIYPQYLWDLRRCVSMNGLTVTSLIGMHMSPTPWAKRETTLRDLHVD